MNVKNLLFVLLLVLVGTLCLVVLLGCVGVAYGKIDAQYIEGLVSGALLTLILTLLKDLVNGDDGSQISIPNKSTDTPKVGA